METFLITQEEYQLLNEKINTIIELLNKNDRSNPLTEIWLDISEVCILLKISKRTLQSYRDSRILPFSKIGGKIYFKALDIENHLKAHYNPSFRNY